MPLGIENYCVSSSDISAATGGLWGLYGIRAAIMGLPSVDGPKTNGRSLKLFRPTDVLPRLRAKKSWSEAFEANLINIIQSKEFQYD